MNSQFKKIQDFFGHLTQTQNKYEYPGINPKRDWVYMIVGVNVLAGVFAVIAFYIYLQIEQGKLFISPPADTPSAIKIDTTTLDTIIADFDVRKNKNDLILGGGLVVPKDPSL